MILAAVLAEVILVFFLNIMLRVFSTPAPESSQFILKLQVSDPRRAPDEIVFGTPPYNNNNNNNNNNMSYALDASTTSCVTYASYMCLETS